MPAFIDITGQVYGRLTVIEQVQSIGGRTAWLCQCACGEYTTATGNDLRTGKTLSCGCLKKELASANSSKAGKARGTQLTKHGMHETRLYAVWKAMRQRCNNPSNKNYPDYGGRGIRICNEWNDFMNFYEWAMRCGYDHNASVMQCTIDRIDVNGDYCPDNCRWVDSKTQANNRRKRRCSRLPKGKSQQQ